MRSLQRFGRPSAVLNQSSHATIQRFTKLTRAAAAPPRLWFRLESACVATKAPRYELVFLDDPAAPTAPEGSVMPDDDSEVEVKESSEEADDGDDYDDDEGGGGDGEDSDDEGDDDDDDDDDAEARKVQTCSNCKKGGHNRQRCPSLHVATNSASGSSSDGSSITSARPEGSRKAASPEKGGSASARPSPSKLPKPECGPSPSMYSGHFATQDVHSPSVLRTVYSGHFATQDVHGPFKRE